MGKKEKFLKRMLVITLTGVLVAASFCGCGKTADNISTEDNARTEKNAELIKEYAAQLLADEKNNPEDLSTGGFVWDTEQKKDSWRYFNGVMLDSFLQLGSEEGQAYVDRFYEDNIDEQGAIRNYHSEELDSVPSGLGLFYVLEGDDTGKYQTAINFIYNELEKQVSYDSCGGNYLHKPSWKEWHIGLDGIYMAQPFLMRCANAIDEGKLSLTSVDGHAVTSEEIYTAVYHRINWVAETMYDENSKLYHHGWNVDKNAGNAHFWGRGIGWYAIALVDVIGAMPDGEQKNTLIGQLPKLLDGMLIYQDGETGLWYNVVNNPNLENNKLETSVSAMMAYALLTAYHNKWVTAEVYKEAGLKAFNGIVETKVIEVNGKYSVTDTYQKSGVGTEDAYYVKNQYVADEGKGTGALIMAAMKALELVK